MLNFIKTKKCPICGCSAIIKETVEKDNLNKNKIREHCNGGRWETRLFACGYGIEYVPNCKEEMKVFYSNCENDPVLLQEKNKRKEVTLKIIEYAKNIGATERYIDYIKKGECNW